MLKYVNGDLVKDKKYTVFCHQVNCKGVMGSGIAAQIRNKYPVVYLLYDEYCRTHPNKLGSIFGIGTGDGRICVNMFAQDGYGRDKQYTSYIAFESCLKMLQEFLLDMSPERIVAFPYKIGCGMGGGDWDIIESMLKHFAHEVKQEVYIVKK